MAPSSRIYVAVVGTGSPGSPKSVLLCTDKTRYLINCGEGTQRILTEHKSKASKIQHVFFTRMSWRHLSGLLGIGLTVKTAGVKQLFVHGPPSIIRLMRLTRHFADVSTSEIVQSNILQTPLIDDDFRIIAFELNVEEIEPRAKCSRTEEPIDPQPVYAYLFQCLKQNRKLDPTKCVACGIPNEVMCSPKIRQLIEGQPLVLDDGKVISPSDVTSEPITPRNILVNDTCYYLANLIYQGPSVKELFTRFNYNVFIEWIRPFKNIRNASRILECPHESYISRFLQASSIFDAIESFQESAGNIRGTVPGVDLVIHMVPEGLFESPQYQALVTRLDQCGQKTEPTDGEGPQEQSGKDGLHHLVLDGSSCRPACSPVTGIFSQSAVLNAYFDSQVYPKLDALRSSKRPEMTSLAALAMTAQSNRRLPWRPSQFALTMALYLFQNKLKRPDLSRIKPFSKVVYAEPMLKYNIRPHSGFSTEACIVLDEQKLIQQSFEPLYVTEDEAAEKCKVMREEVEAAIIKRSKDAIVSPLDELEWPEFTFLGTASSSPSKYRNISAILVRLSPNDCILLDCAEGTLNQFYFLYGIEETHKLLRGLKLILITHMHADHHGATRKVHELTRNTEGLAVLAPTPFWRWVNNYSELFNSCSSTKHVRLFCIDRVYEDPVSTSASSVSEMDALNAKVNPAWQLKQSVGCVTAWSSLLSQLKLRVEPVKVPHTGTSWAYVISRLKKSDGNDGTLWKVVYSGDTPPCLQLAEGGRDCDLLIHEATMGDGYEEQAVKARHSYLKGPTESGYIFLHRIIGLLKSSQDTTAVPIIRRPSTELDYGTTGEAIQIGRIMRAKFILLTHFSQRFSRLPSFDTFQEDIAPAFDFMQSHRMCTNRSRLPKP
ncbi:hypothetical protein ACTXT7_003756 [Hymenolepis weldensis]